MTHVTPPAYAWDWVARHRVLWRECRHRLIDRATADRATGSSPPHAGDVPDWAADLRDVSAAPSAPARPAPGAPRNYRELDTRAEVMAALRTDYRTDPSVQAVVDAVVSELAFLRRRDVSLESLGVRSAPRGMRWWWAHLAHEPASPVPPSTSSTPTGASEPSAVLPEQLRLVDVFAGYGDGTHRPTDDLS